MIACATFALASVAGTFAQQNPPIKNSSAVTERPRGTAFRTPDAAAAALYAAARSGDENELSILLGLSRNSPASSTDNPNEHADERRVFADKYEQMHRLVKQSGNTVALYVGTENWPVPVSIVEYEGRWYIDAGSLPDPLSLSQPELPRQPLWEPFHIELSASGGTEPYHWRAAEGSFPHGVVLSDRGELSGSLEEPGPFRLSVFVRDNSNPPRELKQVYQLRAEVPLTIDWKRKALVSGQRIDGSIKVSNHTGRNLDLTFVVLAVNDIGRATAIGYQHFPLERGARDMELPFGDTLSTGNYVVHVDVVGEEQISKQIFRARLVAERKSITEGP